jgi:hypothetical protein
MKTATRGRDLQGGVPAEGRARYPMRLWRPSFCSEIFAIQLLCPKERRREIGVKMIAIQEEVAINYCAGGTASVGAFDCRGAFSFSAVPYEPRMASIYSWYSLLRYPSASFCFLAK